MPAEILFNNLEELVDKLKNLKSPILDCRVKVNEGNVKLKIRTKRRLYTAVLEPSKVGVDINTLKDRAKELATNAGCKEVTVIE